MSKNALIFSLFFALALVSCGSNDDTTDDDINEEQFVAPTVQTNDVVNISDLSARLSGTLISEGSETVNGRGVAWSLNTNPTIDDSSLQADGSGLGSFFVDAENSFSPATTYNVRAFVLTNMGEVFYGDNRSFTTTSNDTSTPLLETDIPKEITTRSTLLSATVFDDGSGLGARGFAISTLPNPDASDTLLDEGNIGPGTYEVLAEDLEPNTIYYARPFVFSNGIRTFGEEVNFRTVGFPGPAQGVVVYDKGFESDGWQFLEAYPLEDIRAVWGCPTTFISGTTPNLGAGQENTILLLAGCSQSDSAARIVDNLNYNGFGDWFLPSTEELSVGLIGLADTNVLSDVNNRWTSTQAAFDRAFYVSYSSQGTTFVSTQGKNFENLVMPIRRY